VIQLRLTRQQWIWGLLRLSVGWLCLWSFLDKTFGFGFPTLQQWAWMNGGSPTYSFLRFGAKGVLGSVAPFFVFNSLLDWAFMMAMLFIGISFMTGIAVRLAGWLSAVLFVGMHLVGFGPPSNNPFLSELLIYALLGVGFALTPAGHYLGLGRWWAKTRIVKRYSFLQ
jgi:thiosulfate dehydrogenase [quinone] large subunit